MTRATRKTCREKLGADLETAMTGAGNPAQLVYDYFKTDFTESPVVCVSSESQEQTAMTFEGNRADYGFLIIVFVARGEDEEEGAEDALDDCADKIYTYVESNRVVADTWQGLHVPQPSDIVAVTVGGAPYLMETHYVGMESY